MMRQVSSLARFAVPVARCISSVSTRTSALIAQPLSVVSFARNDFVRNFSSKAPLTKKTLEDRIILVLSLYDKIDPKKLTMDSDFSKDLGLDSLDHVEVVMAMEEEFGFEIPDGDADRLKTPRHIFQYIADREDVFE